MYPFGYLPSQGTQPQVFAYTYMPSSVVLPPVQLHSFNSQPLPPLVDDQARSQFYTQSSCSPCQYPVWSLEHWNPVFYNLSYGTGGFYTQSRPGWAGPSQEVWSEGSFFSGELRWGRINRCWSPIKELPDFVRDDLLRVYGTYPYTEVHITYQDGEFLVRGRPRVGQQEYRVERRVVRGTPVPPKSGIEAEVSRGDEEAEGNRRNQS
ncbi:uncharacterized protein C10orf95 homolog [Sminthopsis crassicaudata]|uniref:uncharacterized protein C10orf95 homolog n=1 Tax=Sminthopsis crassicaudata TaxID=9301 RepID=UPI003D69D744